MYKKRFTSPQHIKFYDFMLSNVCDGKIYSVVSYVKLSNSIFQIRVLIIRIIKAYGW